MKRVALMTAACSLALGLTATAFAAPPSKGDDADKAKTPEEASFFNMPDSTTTGSVTVAGRRIDYKAVAGTILVHPKGWDDAKDDSAGDSGASGDKGKGGDEEKPAEAEMFYVAYFKQGAGPRPVTFIYNGGPGSATVWLHMGAFGPKRVVTSDDTHTPAAPYKLVNNDSSLLDASDLVFIDMPGAGFSRLRGKDAKKAFFGIDEDAHAFCEFITAFLSKYDRWNSPKYLFGESYGTTRSAVVAAMLENNYAVDLNGVILLSQILNFDLSVDGATLNPAVDAAYEVALPTYSATAWYHKKLPDGAPTDLSALLKEVENFAMNDYALALGAGGALSDEKRDEIANKLHEYTGLPVSYIKKADLRIDGGEFEKSLQDEANLTTGRLDTRFSGPTIDPLSQRADYDPQSAAISSAYVSAFNDYVRTDLKFGEGKTYKLFAGTFPGWSFEHQQPTGGFPFGSATNVMPDLAFAMKYNPNLKVLLNAGYYDLATPFYEGIYEMRHLTIPKSMMSNISYAFYNSGHMVYAHEESLKQLHDNVADFIRTTDNLGANQ